jgi:hypothetical protein
MNSLKQTRIEILLLFMLYLFILPRAYMEYDMGFWRQWALYIHQHGLANTYSAGSPINYFPVFVYGLYVYDLLQGTEANIVANINSIKILFVCFDFLPLLVLCGFRQRLLSLKIPHLFLLLNVAYVFNSMVWGQIDSIYTSLAFLAIITGLYYPVISVLLYLLALNTKPQAIEFLPVMIAVLWYSVRNIKTIAVALISAGVLQLLLLWPFLDGAVAIADIAVHAVGRYNNLSISAFNIWYLIAKGNPYFIHDTDVYLLFSYRTLGLILFTASCIWLFVPLMKKVWSLRKNMRAPDEQTYRMLFLSTGLLCLYFFYFNSQMHERYAQPIILFFFFYGAASGNYRLYVLASIPYILSLDKCFSYPNGYLPIVHYKIIYASKIIALWYTAAVLYGSYLWHLTTKELALSAKPARA